MTVKRSATVLVTLAVAVLMICPAAVTADESLGVVYSPLVIVYGGLLLVNGGIAVANGISLMAGTANRTNGKLGLVMGAATAILGGALYAWAGGDKEDETAALVLGGAGAASAVVGWFAMRGARERETGARVNAGIAPRSGGFSVGMVIRF